MLLRGRFVSFKFKLDQLAGLSQTPLRHGQAWRLKSSSLAPLNHVIHFQQSACQTGDALPSSTVHINLRFEEIVHGDPIECTQNSIRADAPKPQ